MKAWAAILPLLLALAACEDGGDAPSTAPNAPAAEINTEAADFSGANAYTHCARICELGPRPSGSAAYGKQLDYLQTQLEAYGWTVTRQSFTLTDGTPMTNLHATFGEAAGTRPLLISCHIDTKRLPGFIGADDGASAAATILELARVLAREPELAWRVELVFYDGEESFSGRMNRQNSLYGSRYDAAARMASGTLPRWQINLDMTGGRDKVTAPPVLDAAPGLLEQYDLAVQTLNYSYRRWTLYPGSYLDDHTPFMDAGVPTLNLIAEFSGSDWWHTTKDTMDRISAPSLEDTGKLTLQIVRQLLQTAE